MGGLVASYSAPRLIKNTKLVGILSLGLIIFFTNLYFLQFWPDTKGPPERNWNNKNQYKWTIPLRTGLVEAIPLERSGKNFPTTENPPKKTFTSDFATKRTLKRNWNDKHQDKWTIPLRTGLVEAIPLERSGKNFPTTENPPKKTFTSDFATKRTLKRNWNNKHQDKWTIPLKTGLVEAIPLRRRKNFPTTENPPKKTFISDFATKGTLKRNWNNKDRDKWTIPLRTGLVEAIPLERRKNFPFTENPPKKTFTSDFATKRTLERNWNNKVQDKWTIPLRTGLVEAISLERRKNIPTNENPPKKTFTSDFATKGTPARNWNIKVQDKWTIPLRTGLVEAISLERRKNIPTNENPPKKTFTSDFATKGTPERNWNNKVQDNGTIPLRTGLVEAIPMEQRKTFPTAENPPKRTFTSDFATKGTLERNWNNKDQNKWTIPLKTGLVEAISLGRRKNFPTTENPPKKTFTSDFATKGTTERNWKNKDRNKWTIPLRTGLVEAIPLERRNNFPTTENPPKKTFTSDFATKGTTERNWNNKDQNKWTIPLRTGLVEAIPLGRRKTFLTTENPPKKTFTSDFATKRNTERNWNNKDKNKWTIPLRTGLVEAIPLERRKTFLTTENPPKRTFTSDFTTKGTPERNWTIKDQNKRTIPLRTGLVEAIPLERRKNFLTTENPPKKTFTSDFATKRTTERNWNNKDKNKWTIPLRTGLVEAIPLERRKTFLTTENPPKRTFTSDFATKRTTDRDWNNKDQNKWTIPLRTGLVEAIPLERRKNFLTTENPPKRTFTSDFATKRTTDRDWNNKDQNKWTIPLRTGLVEAIPLERKKNFLTTENPPKMTFTSDFATKRTTDRDWNNKDQNKWTIPLRTGLVETIPLEQRKTFLTTENPPKRTFTSDFATKGTAERNWNNKDQNKRTIPLRTGLVEAIPLERRKNFLTTENPPKKTFTSDFATKGKSRTIWKNKEQVKTTNPQSGSFLKNETRSCAHRINVMEGGIVLFRNITVQSKLGRARVLETYYEQPAAEDEFFKLKRGFFTLYCRGNVNEVKERLYSAKTHYALSKWITALEVANPSIAVLLGAKQSFHAGQYLAIQRIEYANVYWTIIDLLDIFITTQRLGIEPEKLNIVLMDAHPPSSLDPFWSVLFQRLIKLGTDDIFKHSNNVMFENLVWRYPRVNCPLLDRKSVTSYLIQPFRSFVLKRFGIPSGPRFRDCARKKLNVLVAFRRDYQNHPRNVKGIIDRKIANEEDVVKEMENGFPTLNITTAQLDSLPLKRQLELIASADIFFGMHGAAHAFPIFMAPGGVVIEMFNFQSNNWHMKRISTLSGHFHITWTNQDLKAYNQTTRSTTIPAGIPSKLLRKAIDDICAQKLDIQKDRLQSALSNPPRILMRWLV